ncbi:TPA: hypothetical protein DEQ95_02705 [Candidatus Beckwithbacteria bacterium]|nr:MAG: glycosyl transferase [Candidatus Beckwithbacteria bacterium GW2011_GWC1_49_16]OGD49105.1 MAG: hypothetical protein A2877_00400 [Candidatus Beckwithbacteria bacterium RIFCSPHIGHO2_01_FULL_49_39]OGD50107.1 MAG: hypothetical protein A3K56_00125 [Candidatus Beckwithbacteria bacterium RIFCSPHIGHO2_12_FULL_49_13]OGD51206.1 MAG: hypothetical protein A3D86_02990 [Candidatus Beckwithbacteria bacterium RIFCSPHIGHO2_02_FULL_49_13]OGD57551.1 MAG: hypothetical protein A3J22_03390 [Candidatus Beckwit
MNKALTVMTLNRPGIADFSRERNRLLKQAQTPWVLFLDSDEKLTSELKSQINRAVTDRRFNYNFRRQDWFLGKHLKFGETAAVKFTRLVQPGTGRFTGRVHEIFVSRLPLKTLSAPLLHQRNLSFSLFLDRLNFYSELRARELVGQNAAFKLWQLIVYPPAKFILNYFFRLGFLDRLPGLALALAMSLHSLAVRVKVYEKTFANR